jgi:hypothetical protein
MGRYTHVSGYIDIDDIELCSVPAKISLNYNISKIKKSFGKNCKILGSLSCFNSPELWLRCKGVYSQIHKLESAKSRKAILDKIKNDINTLSGTAQQIMSSMDVAWFDALEEQDMYADILQRFDGITALPTKAHRYLFYYQLSEFVKSNKDDIAKACKRIEYESFKQSVQRDLNLLNTTWKQIECEEVRKNLIVKFPQANEISNGQRDFLTFVIDLLKFESKIVDDRQYLLLIDEVFDYLDDANIIAAQYFLTKFLERKNGNLYLCILTHLNPNSFRSYLFSKKRLNYVCLKKTEPVATDAMKAFISFRNNLDRNDVGQDTLYDNLSCYLFHYNPTAVDLSNSIDTYKKIQHLRTSWGKTQKLHEELIKEVNAYLSENANYDPYAVAFALRLRVEKCIYDRLPDDKKHQFLSEKTTKSKFEFAERVNVEVPEAYYIVNAIHNEADHLKINETSNEYMEKSVVYKLQNNVIREIIKQIFDLKNEDIMREAID